MVRKERVLLSTAARHKMKHQAKNGRTLEELAASFDVSTATVRNICSGIPLTSKTHIPKTSEVTLSKVESLALRKSWRISKPMIAKMKQLRDEGYTNMTIAEKLECDPSTVSYHLSPKVKKHKETMNKWSNKSPYQKSSREHQGKAFDYPAWYVLVGFVVFLLAVFVALRK
jgi:hypothetical protein